MTTASLRRPVRAAARRLIAAALVGGSVLSFGTPAQAATIAHPSLVPSTASRGYPVINSTPALADGSLRAVLAANQVGSYIVSGGNFATVTLQNGTVLAKPFFAVWSLTSKQIACTNLAVDNEVLAVVPDQTGRTAYIAGRFSKITVGSTVYRRARVARVDLTTCTVDPTFVAPAITGRVDELALTGNRLFLGGDFETVGGVANSTIAEVDATTGARNAAFTFSVSGALTSRVKALATNPAGTRLVVAGRFGQLSRDGVSVINPTAVVDISGATPVLTAHSSTGYTNAHGSSMPIADLTDASVSPDASVVGLAFGTATLSDYVYLTPTTETAGTRYRWRHYMRDSTFGIGVSNNAVYVAGHFCKPDAGPAAVDVMTTSPGITSACTGSKMLGGVWRGKLAALSLTDGTPLAWNPGNASFRGGSEVTVTPRGLLVGYDGEKTSNYRVGALAMFDLGVANT